MCEVTAVLIHPMLFYHSQIIVGNRGLSPSQGKVQMAMWAMFSAPLFLSADLRNVDAESKALMQHKGVIAINQDKLGKMAKRVFYPVSLQSRLLSVVLILLLVAGSFLK